MTKKSLARIQRDKEQNQAKKDLDDFRKSDKTWNNLEELYQQNYSMLLSIPVKISNLYSVDKIQNFLTDVNLTTELIRCLSGDLKVMHIELEEIYNSHKGKTGNCSNEEDFVSSLTIVEAYSAFKTKFEGVIMLTINTLGLHFDEAIQKVDDIVKNSQKENAVLDPTVITDVVVKE